MNVGHVPIILLFVTSVNIFRVLFVGYAHDSAYRAVLNGQYATDKQFCDLFVELKWTRHYGLSVFVLINTRAV